MSEFERKPDGGLNAWIETYEAMGDGENDAEMLCLLLELRRLRENQAEAEREHDELRKVLQETQVGLIDAINHASQLQAELSRRDAAAGKPFAYVITDKDDREAGRPGSLSFMGVRAYKDDDVNEYELSEQPLYDSAPPAVLPDIDGYTHGLFPHAVEQLTRFRDDALALGAQQQKVVELDNVFSINVAGVPVRVILLKDVSISLEAAGVKWEVKK